MDSKFKYEVHPRIPIRNLIPQKAITRPTQLDLSKDEVKLCLKHGPVIRLFDRTTQVKVTLYNLDEVHVAKYNAPASKGNIDPAKKTDVYETIVIPKAEEKAPVVEEAPATPVVEEPKAEEPIVVEPIPTAEPVQEAAPSAEEPVAVAPIPVVSNIVEEKAPVVEESAPEVPVEAASEEAEVVESSEEENAEESTEDDDTEDSEDDEEDEEEEEPVAGQPNGQNSNQYHPNKKKKKHH